MIAVADGMGGYQDGDAASRIAVKMLERWWNKRLEKLLKKKDPLRRVLEEVNKLMQEMNETLLAYGKKLGTTLSILILYQGKYAISHVGDSRIFQLKGAFIGFQNYFRQENEKVELDSLKLQNTEVLEADYELSQLTEDHSWSNSKCVKEN